MASLLAENEVAPRVANGGAPVLVVNSNAAARANICGLLTAARFDACSCATAGEALARLRAAPALAMVVDYMLDDMSGFALVHACNDAGFAPATVMTAARGEVSAAVQAVREGIADFLPGPPDGRIVQAVRAALRKVS
ncbi:MAG: response regulator [Gammaproteobacteria bacterium]